MRTPQQSARRALIKTVSRGGATPIYRQIYERVRRGIATGSYQPGSRLPSARELASDLGVARGTVEDAYGLLLAEGYIERRGQQGSVVAHSLSGGDASARLVAPIASHKTETRPSRRSGDGPVSPFQLGQPAFDAFPQPAWSRLIVRFARRSPAGGIGHPDYDGYFPLKIAIARYLGLSRGVACSPGQILITNGYQAAIDLVGRSLLRPGDAVWFEEPGYVFGRDALLAAGAHVVPIGVDEDGLNIAEGIASAPKAKMIVTTPAHQSPLCVALSLPRRLQLLEWAREKNAWIVEDDYDGEFHYGGRPLPALKSLDRHDRVIYAGSFSKTLLPELRLGYLVVPLALVEPLAAAARARSAAPGLLMQAVVAEFLNSGQFARHLHRMRRLYADRRQALADALLQTFGNLLSIEMENGGMHLLARIPASGNDVRIAKIAAASGLAVNALSETYMGSANQRGLLLGFTNVPVNKARTLCRSLHREIAGALDGKV
ncbi:MAG: PLP-dependent aminotransferase family protein [Hyphomicrobiaceae bacterium]